MPRKRIEHKNGMKFCHSCQEWKLLSKFSSKMDAWDGLRSYCRECHKIKTQKYVENNRDKVKLQRLKAKVKTRYNISVEKYLKVMSKNCCSICGSNKNIQLDHCHESGLVRDALCFSCNVGIGNFKDNPSLLKEAADYVQYWKKQHAKKT